MTTVQSWAPEAQTSSIVRLTGESLGARLDRSRTDADE